MLVAAKTAGLVIRILNNIVTRRSGLTMMFIQTEKSLRVVSPKPPWSNRSNNSIQSLISLALTQTQTQLLLSNFSVVN